LAETRVFFEPKIPLHDPALYAFERLEDGVPADAAEAALARYREDGFLMVRGLLPEALLSAVPVPDPRRRRERIVLAGEVADPSNPPTGCHFHPRCPYVIERCRREEPALRQLESGHLTRCHRAEELSLAGVQGETRSSIPRRAAQKGATLG
jgi:oligopeptide/dipeptide ABC transporter ATP-binding protein